MSETRAISTTSRRELSSSFFFPARQGAERNSRHSYTCFLPGRAKDLSAPLYHVRDARDFNNIETRAVIKFFFSLQGKAPKEIHAIPTLVSFLVGLRTYQHPCTMNFTIYHPRFIPRLRIHKLGSKHLSAARSDFLAADFNCD